MNRIPALLCSLLVALLAGACSSAPSPSDVAFGAEGESAVAATATATSRGTIYLSTTDGDLLTIDPAREAAGVLWQSNDGDQLPVFEVAPANKSKDLYVAFNDPQQGLFTSLRTIAGGSLRPLAGEPLGQYVTCLDNHARAESAIAHQLLLSDGSNGSAFAAFDFDAEGNQSTASITPMGRNSIVCPRWSADRSINVTSAPVIDNDFNTVAMHIDSADASHSIAIESCNLHAGSFSPDDAALLVNVTCYGSRSADSGLYLLPLGSVSSSMQLSDMELLARGVFGRSAFHPDGTAAAAARTDVIPGQTATTDFATADVVLVVIDRESRELQELVLPNSAKPHSIAWLASAVHA